MSDTPDTDALDHELHSPCVLQDRYSEMRDHARRLERERNEWYYKAHANAAFTLEARAERDEARESLENARELNKWLTVFLEHIRDNADIRYGKHRGLLAFSDLREEASRKWKEATK